MASHDYVIANGTGQAVRSDLNNALAAIVSNNSGSSEPSTKYAYQWWADTTTGQLKLRNSANNAWVTIFELDGTMLMEDGTVSAPGLAFASDLNTGFFRSAADKINFATGGVERLEIGSSEVVFNDGSNDVDFRVESNGNTHMLFVDGGNDRVGIGVSSTTHRLHIHEASSGNSFIHVTNSTTGTGAGDGALIGVDSGESLLIAQKENNNIQFHTNNTEAARLDSSGRLLVGTSSSFADSSRLQALTKSSTFEDGISLRHTQFTASSSFKLNFQRSRDNFGGNSAVINGSRLGQINFKGYDGTDYESIGASIYAEVDGTPGANDMPGRLVFSTCADGASSPTERMRIKQNGWRQAIAVDHVETLSSATSAGTTHFIISGRHSGTIGTPDSGTICYTVFTNGNVQNTNNSYGAISDIKLKENIVNASSQWDDLKAIQVRNYNFKEGQTHTQLGVVAQEVELVSPGLVSESPDRDEEGNDLGTTTKSVNYSVLYMKAVKALQEAIAKIEILETKVAALEAG